MESIKQLKAKFHHTKSIITISMFSKYKSIAKLHILTIIWPTVLLWKVNTTHIGFVYTTVLAKIMLLGNYISKQTQKIKFLNEKQRKPSVNLLDQKSMSNFLSLTMIYKIKSISTNTRFKTNFLKWWLRIFMFHVNKNSEIMSKWPVHAHIHITYYFCSTFFVYTLSPNISVDTWYYS